MKENGKLNILKSVMALSFILMIALNSLASFLPLGGSTVAQVSQAYANLFSPVPMTYYIWFVIYALLCLFTLYSLGVFGGTDNALLRRTGLPFIISNLFGAAWVTAWSFYYIWASVILMAGMGVSLAITYGRIIKHELNLKQKWFVKLPFSVYCGWTTIAFIVNVVALLVSLNWKGFGVPDVVWMIIITAAAALIGAMLAIKNRDPVYGIAFIWAYIGLLLNHIGKAGEREFAISVTITAALAVLVTASIIAAVYKKKRLI